MNDAPNLKQGGTRYLEQIGDVLFLFWLLLINILYYLQFHELFLARFGFWIDRWR